MRNKAILCSCSIIFLIILMINWLYIKKQIFLEWVLQIYPYYLTDKYKIKTYRILVTSLFSSFGTVLEQFWNSFGTVLEQFGIGLNVRSLDNLENQFYINIQISYLIYFKMKPFIIHVNTHNKVEDEDVNSIHRTWCSINPRK